MAKKKDNDAGEEAQKQGATTEEIEQPEQAQTQDADMAEEADAFQWKEPPVFEVTHKADCVCEVKVTIPKANVAAMMDEIYDEVNDGVQVPGFRRGKAPRKLLEKRAGKFARSSAMERLTEEASHLLVKQHHVRPVSAAESVGLEDPESLRDDEDLCYTITFDTPGKCTLGEYEGLEIEKPVFEVDDAEVDDAIESMRTRYARFEPLDKGVAESGDQVIIDFIGKIDGEDFEGNHAENYPYILGSQRFSKEMEDAMTGAKSGETVTADITFPDDYRVTEIAGKTAKFEIKVNEIKRRVLPDLDDEYAKKIGHETVSELREAMRSRISEHADEQIQDILRRQARSKLVECCSFELPKSQIKETAESEYRNMEERMMQQHVAPEEIEQHREEMRKTADEQALFMLKSMYAIRALAEKENIVATESDFEEYARSLAAGSRHDYDAMKEYLLSDDMRSMTEFQIVENKVLDRIIERASIVLKPLTDDDEEEEASAEKDKEKKDA